jgi:predicted RNA methylase
MDGNVDGLRPAGQGAGQFANAPVELRVKEFGKRLEYRYLKPVQRWLQPWRYVTYGSVRVHYKRHLDGGGSAFGQDYIPFLHDRGMPKQARVFEWCAGPGFIGFSLLGFGLCDSLCVADVNSEAIRACRRTVAGSGLADRVAVYQSDNLENIPASERWDLVVGNPPHFDWTQIGELRFADTQWRIHQRFFASVGRFLKPGGVILIQENNHGSTAETFRPMIEQAGFSIVMVHGCEPRITPYTRYYYLGIMRHGDTPPAWLIGG